MPEPTEDTRIRAWATQHGHTIPDTEPIPDTIRQQYRKARAYMIRKTYARRNTHTRDISETGRNTEPSTQPPLTIRTAGQPGN